MKLEETPLLRIGKVEQPVMKKVLFLPLFKMESGHHRTTDALMDAFSKGDSSIECEKVDFLGYANQTLEHSISSSYIAVIRKFPNFYSGFYEKYFKEGSPLMHGVYETLFIEKMEQLLAEKQPDLIICTHSFPSFLVSKLKKYGVCKVPIINVYTDFFINSLWGKEKISYHFVPTLEAKKQLEEKGIAPHLIYTTGVLTHDVFKERKGIENGKRKLRLLVGGGSLGLGKNLNFFNTCKGDGAFKYRVLCGSNTKLYKELSELSNPNVLPLPFQTPYQVNEQYEWADALLTKPGGVTISEAIRKHLPLFIHSILPGQEERNVDYLSSKSLIKVLSEDEPFDEQILSFMSNKTLLFKMKNAMKEYERELQMNSCEEVAGFLTRNILNRYESVQVKYITLLFSDLYRTLKV